MIDIKFKNEKSLFIGGDDVAVKADRVIKKIEKYIRKGRCAKADKTDDGYNFKLIDYDYSYQDYHIEVGDHTNSEYACESERLYKLANTKAMKKKFIKTEKDIYTKPSKIFKRNLSELVNYYSDLFTLTFGISAILSLFLTLPVGVCFDFSLPVSMLISGSPFIAQLSTFFLTIPLVSTISELKQNKKSKKKDEDVSKKDNKTSKVEKSIKTEVPKKEQVEVKRPVQNEVKKTVPTKKETTTSSEELNFYLEQYRKEYFRLRNEYETLKKQNASVSQINEVVNKMNAIVRRTNYLVSSSSKTEVVMKEKPVSLLLK